MNEHSSASVKCASSYIVSLKTIKIYEKKNIYIFQRVEIILKINTVKSANQYYFSRAAFSTLLCISHNMRYILKSLFQTLI